MARFVEACRYSVDHPDGDFSTVETYIAAGNDVNAIDNEVCRSRRLPPRLSPSPSLSRSLTLSHALTHPLSLERDRFQSGQTALVAAANGGRPQMVEMLLKAGAQTNITCVRAKPLLVCINARVSMRPRVCLHACHCACMRVCAPRPLILCPSRALSCAQGGHTAREHASNFNRQNREAKEACIALIDRYG